jgi:hypothetical protein
MLNESFLHYLWKFKLLKSSLFTIDGEEIQIISQGVQNFDEGPDFLNAKLKIGETLWAGNIEIHVLASHWKLHKHQQNDKYKSVILHVVYQNDTDLDLKIPVLEVKGKFNEELLHTYENFMKSKQWVACENQIKDIEPLKLNLWLEKLGVERLEKKTQLFVEILQNNKHNWEEAYYQIIARTFGLKVNADAFLNLAKSLPLSILAKHKSSLFQLETLLFGQAGMLQSQFKDEYPQQLQNEYAYLKKKFNLSSIDKKAWHFARLHPSNFPTIRIAQFAHLVFSSSHLLTKSIEAKDLQQFYSLFNCKSSAYWDTHYTFDSKPSAKRVKQFGKTMQQLLLINAVFPFMFYYAKEKGIDKLKDKSIEMLKMLPLEKNKIINKWINIGLQINDSFQSQAAIELKTNYCDKKLCLQCNLGIQLIRN